MPIYVTSNSIGNGPLVDLGTTVLNEGVVLEGVTVAALVGTAAFGTGDRQTVLAAGNIYGNGTVVGLTGFNSAVVVTATGSIEDVAGIGDGSASALINLGASGYVSNAGNIRGDWAINGDDRLEVVNSGYIEASDFDLISAGGDLDLVNSGVMMSIATDFSSGIRSLSQTRIENSGLINAYIQTSNAQDVIKNTGSIVGNIKMELLSDLLVNSGSITGNVDLGGSADTYLGLGASVVSQMVEAGDGNDTLTGGDLGDDLRGDGNDDVVRGRGGDDTLYGGNDEDTVLGGSGQDVIFGGNGNDVMAGGSDGDTLSGGNGNDLVSGNEGDDQVSGDIGNDRLFGNTGDDTMDGGNGNDTLRGGAGNDELFGDANSDFLFGGNDNDTLAGGGNNDFLRGEGGDDLLEGDAGVDDLRGGNGADTLDGGAGGDRLYGGGGPDTFVYATASDSEIGGIDNIYDFRSGLDLLSFEAVAGEFVFNGTGAHSGGGTNSIRYISTAAGVSVRADVDGNGSSDIIVTVRGLNTLTADDFIL